MASFESVVDEYDTARPEYPDQLFDALGPLTGLVTLDAGAGTGIATRALIARRAEVIAVDTGHAVLGRAVARTSGLHAVIADGAALPVDRSGQSQLRRRTSSSARSALLDELRSILTWRFPDRNPSVPYETWLWIGTPS